jgi:hypothetical protein
MALQKQSSAMREGGLSNPGLLPAALRLDLARIAT